MTSQVYINLIKYKHALTKAGVIFLLVLNSDGMFYPEMNEYRPKRQTEVHVVACVGVFAYSCFC